LQKYSQIKKQKKINFLIKTSISLVVVTIVILSGILSSFILKTAERNSISTFNEIKPIFTEDKEVSLIMAGDNLLHMPLIKNAETENGTYNFDSLYEDLLPYFKNADISVIVQETVLGGESLGYSGYPMFNSPQQVGDAIKNAGFDVVLHATNHTLDRGSKGVENTLEYWKTHPEITVLGINESFEKQDEIHYIAKNGIKFALLNYTDSTNGIPLPSGKEYLVNVVDEEKIIKDLTIAEANADFTIVFMHWGVEYSFTESTSQSRLAELMCENGADLIMGSHPHVIEPVKWIESQNGNKALVFYSLGNYVSRQKEVENLLGILGGVTICREDDKKAYIKQATVIPTVTHYNFNSRGFKVYPLKQYTDELASAHGVSQFDGKVSVERFENIFYSVFKDSDTVEIDYKKTQ